MKRQLAGLRGSLLASAILSAALVVLGDQIGVNFVGGSPTHGTPAAFSTSESAGWLPQRFWNNAAGSAGSTNPEGDGGGTISAYYSGFRLSWSAGTGIGSTSIPDLGGNSRLMKGYLASGDGPGTQTIISATGVPSGMVARGYALLVFLDGDCSLGAQVAKVTLSVPGLPNRTLYGLDGANTDFGGSFQVVPSSSISNLGSLTPPGNVAIFNGLHADSFSLSVSGPVNGLQILEAQAANQAPEVTLLAPASGTNLWACVPFVLSAVAIDDLGISKMEFFQGLTKIGETTSSPYQVSWKTDVLGDYDFSAKATDIRGVSTSSSATRFTVGLPPLDELIVYGILADGQCEICMHGEPTRTYAVQATTNWVDWTAAGTMTNANGLLLFKDPTTLPWRFYRAQQQ